MFTQLQPSASTLNLCFLPGNSNYQLKGKMHTYSIFITVFLISLRKVLTIDVMPELKKNVLNFGYSTNFKYEGMLTYSFDRFYVIAK